MPFDYENRENKDSKIKVRADQLSIGEGDKLGVKFDKHSKMHLTQMSPKIDALQKAAKGEALTVMDFNEGDVYNSISAKTQRSGLQGYTREAKAKDREELSKHYSFIKGTTYSIGKAGTK
jgi:hypothetical protein